MNFSNQKHVFISDVGRLAWKVKIVNVIIKQISHNYGYYAKCIPVLLRNSLEEHVVSNTSHFT